MPKHGGDVQAVRKRPSSAAHPWTTIPPTRTPPRSGTTGERDHGEIDFKTGFGRGVCGGSWPPSAPRSVRRVATDWPSTNYDETANRYSPLDQITAANVATLQQAWSFHLKPAGYTGRLREDEAIPLVIGNTMYLASPYGAIHALDATTGAEKWKFQLPNNDLPSKRGLAYWPGGDGVAAVDHLRRAVGRACTRSRRRTARSTPASARTASST